MADVPGVHISTGPANWQIFQQDSTGHADIALAGTWRGEGEPIGVFVRLVREENAQPINARLDWLPARTTADGTWSVVIRKVPAGGLYRLETQLRQPDAPDAEWARRGDVRHFIGVGDLWIISGQSNSAGYGRGPCHDPPTLGVHLLGNNLKWSLAAQPLADSTDTAHPANREYCNPGHSPWLHFARLLQQNLHHPIGLIQTALGGQPLSRWNPKEPGDNDLFDVLVQSAQAAGGRVRGVLWYQGETDCDKLETAKTYLRRFKQAVAAWRKALKSPKLHVLTVQIGRVYEARTAEAHVNYCLVREAQRQAARQIRNVTVSPSLDLPFSDFIHVSGQGNLLLAERMAQTALGAVYNHPVAWRAPEPRAAKLLPGRQTVDITFENITGIFRPTDRVASPFTITDRDGEVPVTKTEYLKGNIVRLHTARPVTSPAYVHGAAGSNPPAAPVDLTRLIPMLAFHNLPITA